MTDTTDREIARGIAARWPYAGNAAHREQLADEIAQALTAARREGMDASEATIAALRTERDADYRHAVRLLDALHPGLSKLGNVCGVIDQIDNVTVGLQRRAEAAEAERAKLAGQLAALQPTP